MKIKTIPAEAAEPIATLFLEPFLKSLIKKEDGTYFSKELNRSYKINDKGELEEIADDNTKSSQKGH